MPKANEAVSLEYSTGKGANAVTNVNVLRSKMRKAQSDKIKAIIGYDDTLKANPLDVVLKDGESHKLSSLSDLFDTPALFKSSNSDNPSFGYRFTLEDFLATEKKKLVWIHEVTKGTGKRAKRVQETRVATARELRGAIVDGWGKADGDLNRENAQAIRGAWTSFLAKRYKMFLADVHEAYVMDGRKLTKKMEEWADKQVATHTRTANHDTIVKLIGSETHKPDSEFFRKVVQPSCPAEVLAQHEAKQIRVSAVGQIMMALHSQAGRETYTSSFRSKVEGYCVTFYNNVKKAKAHKDSKKSS